MIALIEDNREAIASLCQRYGVQRLAVFGSAVRGTFDAASSDIDFVVDLGAYDPGVGMRYLGLIIALERLLERPVDVVTLHNNTRPWFREEVERTAVILYEHQHPAVVA